MTVITGRGRRAPGAGVRRQDNRLAYLMLAPLVILLGIFVIWPLIYAGYLSFFNWSFYQASEFVGWRNFSNVLTDRQFVESILRGLRFALMVVPSILVIAFLFASLVKTMGRRAATLLKVSIYIPTVISGVIASIIFVLIYDYSGGIANWVVGWFGIEAQAWIGDVRLALPAIAVPAIWMGLGISALIMLAGLLDIPESYYEAAELEGANWFQRTWYITLPLMKNIFLYLLIAGFTLAIQQFELPLIMTDGGPLDSTLLPNLFIFNHFRDDLFVGYSIAAALLLFLVLGSISALIFKALNSEKAVDG
ncbi:carbohydrate ABC transporter permease [Phytoactinopolyspora limicola]|uniref:carbohydrate ABC transporter permease n=1 Tax=Phytoactinopolyspora limicola TaxID=2715536 RepID=UPI00140DE0AC|nr:sugar ABC transporter permease [Phytoactinopolyspora limicola]